jgi:hypothetical protein
MPRKIVVVLRGLLVDEVRTNDYSIENVEFVVMDDDDSSGTGKFTDAQEAQLKKDFPFVLHQSK